MLKSMLRVDKIPTLIIEDGVWLLQDNSTGERVKILLAEGAEVNLEGGLLKLKGEILLSGADTIESPEYLEMRTGIKSKS